MNNESSNKRQRLSNDAIPLPQEDQPGFLGFDYDFTNNAMMPQQPQPQNPASIPDNFFMFAGDNITPTEPEPNMASLTSPPIAQVPPRPQSLTPPQHQLPPNQAVYTLIVGGRTFRLSWESLNSDGPSNFFTEYFRKQQGSKVMHIDRDPDIFELVVRHLRGYYVRPIDDVQNRSLLFDANYYGLNRLVKFLHDFLYINVGGRVFRLPWSLFEKGLLVTVRVRSKLADTL